MAVLLHQRVALGLAQILAHHFLDELLEARLRLPAQFLFRPRGIADEGVDFGGPEIARVHGDDFFSRGVERVLVGALALPPEADVEPRRREVHEFAHAVLLARRDHQILGLGLLQHQPLRLDIVARVAPVAPRVEVAEVQAILHSELDAGEAARDLARDEDLAADRRFVVEEDAVAGIEAVGLAVVDRDPVRVELRHAVGRARIEGSRFALRRLPRQAEELGGRRLVEPGSLAESQRAHRFEQAQGSERVGIGGVLGLVEGHVDVALGGEVVDLVGLHFLQDVHQAARVGHVAVVQEHAHLGLVHVAVQVVDPRRVEERGAPPHAVHFVALPEQELGEVGAVLAGDAGDQRFFRVGHRLVLCSKARGTRRVAYIARAEWPEASDVD